jgi:sialate O-acetylesterase
MHITTGLFDHMVLQRTPENASNAAISGETAANGPVRAKVTLKGRALPGFANKTIGNAARGKFTATLAGLPTGGPYDITLTIGSDSLTVTDVLVGDVWIAAGQSNMQGCGLLTEALKPHPLCRAFYMHDRWDIARDPIHNLGQALDQVHADISPRPAGKQPKPVIGTGPAIGFIQEMHRLTNVPQGVIACAHGGTSMAQWDPAKKSLGSKSLYGATLRRFQKNGGSVAGLIWYQGESETAVAENARNYPANMRKLVAAFRRDLHNPNLPVAAVQISRVVGHNEFAHWNLVQEHQRRLPEHIKRLTVVPAIDLILDDGIHIGGNDSNRLGKRLARAMLWLLKHPASDPAPIAVKRITARIGPNRILADVIVEFANVVGKLSGGLRPSGFALVDDNGLNFVYDVKLQKNRAILRTDCSLQTLAGKKLHYGFGYDPLCNITDAADRSLPAFGPVILPGKSKRM